MGWRGNIYIYHTYTKQFDKDVKIALLFIRIAWIVLCNIKLNISMTKNNKQLFLDYGICPLWVGWKLYSYVIIVLTAGQADRFPKYSHARKKGNSVGSCSDIKCSDPEVTQITSAHNFLAKTSYMAIPRCKDLRCLIHQGH